MPLGIKASFNPETGAPRIIGATSGRIKAQGSYTTLAMYKWRDKTYIVASKFWEGLLPTNTLLEVREVEPAQPSLESTLNQFAVSGRKL